MSQKRYSASQQLRLRIYELHTVLGSKTAFEDFYQQKMKEFERKISDKIFEIQNQDEPS